MFRSAHRPRTQAVIPLLFAILVAAVLPHHVLSLVCRSGAIMPIDFEACCATPAGADDGTSASEEKAWRDEACCSLRASHLDQGTPERDARTVSFAPALAVLLPVGLSPPAPIAALSRAVSPASPPPRPSLVLLKSSFLL